MEQDEVDVGVLTHQSQNGAVVNVESKQRLANALLQHPHCATFAPSSKMASVLFFFLVCLPSTSVSHSAVFVS